jgi:hypothetical protein
MHRSFSQEAGTFSDLGQQVDTQTLLVSGISSGNAHVASAVESLVQSESGWPEESAIVDLLASRADAMASESFEGLWLADIHGAIAAAHQRAALEQRRKSESSGGACLSQPDTERALLEHLTLLKVRLNEETKSHVVASCNCFVTSLLLKTTKRRPA